MKRCPTCNLEYRDGTMEFCLEDGTRLVPSQAPVVTAEVWPRGETSGRAPQETVVMPPAVTTSDAPVHRTDEVETVVANQSSFLPVAEVHEKTDILAYASIATALAHNWWQWLYLENQYVYSVAAYVLSANFLMWVMLLIGGAVLGLLALRKKKSRLPYLSLTILAINLILILVPRK